MPPAPGRVGSAPPGPGGLAGCFMVPPYAALLGGGATALAGCLIVPPYAGLLGGGGAAAFAPACGAALPPAGGAAFLPAAADAAPAPHAPTGRGGTLPPPIPGRFGPFLTQKQR